MKKTRTDAFENNSIKVPFVVPNIEPSDKHAIEIALKSTLLTDGPILKKFESAFFDLLENQSKQKELSRNIKKMALPNATSSIVDEIEKLIIRKA